MKVTYHYYTGTGHRSANQDCIGMNEWKNGYVFAVADGSGKMPYGAIASKIAVETVLRIGGREEPCKRFTRSLYQLVERMLQRTMETEHYPAKSLKTTMATLQIDTKEECFYLGHQGDCRVYVFRNGEKFVRTRDHSIAQKMVDQRLITEQQMKTVAERRQITRILGVGLQHACEATDAYALMDQMAFLLCTDGFWNAIEDAEMEQLLQKATTAEEWLCSMQDIVQKRGEQSTIYDNQSAIAIMVMEE